MAEILHPSGSTRVKTWARQQPEATLYLSILTIGEYEKGIAKLPQTDPRRATFPTRRDQRTRRFAGRILPISDGIVRRWGAISGTAKRDSGHPPPIIDTLLAATALDRNLHLVTRNVRHSGASVFNPWQDDPVNFPIMPGIV